jgi:hypothetical protein
MAVDLKGHPGLNPDYFRLKAEREEALEMKRKGIPVRIPPQPNKYIPHIGAKQKAKKGEPNA